MTERCFESASALAQRIATREVSAVAVLEAHLAQIARVNPALNALVQPDAERARASAQAASRR
ncbi:MAG: hypothetical protein WCI67_09950 [Chloroflexales bacterium]